MLYIATKPSFLLHPQYCLYFSQITENMIPRTVALVFAWTGFQTWLLFNHTGEFTGLFLENYFNFCTFLKDLNSEIIYTVSKS